MNTNTNQDTIDYCRGHVAGRVKGFRSGFWKGVSFGFGVGAIVVCTIAALNSK